MIQVIHLRSLPLCLLIAKCSASDEESVSYFKVFKNLTFKSQV